jgi:hypothetical protein
MDHHAHWRSFAFPRGLRAYVITAVWLLLAPALAWSQAADLRPVIFVHGSSGSAIQFETQAMRFTSNGYPQQLLFAFEYDTSVATNGEQIGRRPRCVRRWCPQPDRCDAGQCRCAFPRHDRHAPLPE